MEILCMQYYLFDLRLPWGFIVSLEAAELWKKLLAIS